MVGCGRCGRAARASERRLSGDSGRSVDAEASEASRSALLRLVGERRPAEASNSGIGETIDACVSELERPLSMGESSGGAEEDAARAAGLTMTRSDAEEAAATELGVILSGRKFCAARADVRSLSRCAARSF